VRRTLEFRKLHPFTRCFVKVNFFLVQKCVARFFITRVNFYYLFFLRIFNGNDSRRRVKKICHSDSGIDPILLFEGGEPGLSPAENSGFQLE
jgi:hypothetical protein